MNHCISPFEDPRDPISDVQTVRYWIHPSNYLNSMTSQWIKVLSSVYSKLCMCNKYDGNGRQGSTNQNSNRSGPNKILDDRSDGNRLDQITDSLTEFQSNQSVDPWWEEWRIHKKMTAEAHICFTMGKFESNIGSIDVRANVRLSAMPFRIRLFVICRKCQNSRNIFCHSI